ncbi:PIN domain-containing protein [Xanthomonas sp. MLO165]|uniref:PIN domain-containing protein n=1 Tax=Xanthomonas sp. MLO165 TaxID=2081477 RepID=UPI001C04685B|nr:PIN domain-containing protein [Xanthomonas sp. MLO165]
MSKRIYLVPDTNVLVQCRPLVELPWKEVFPGFDSIILVLIAPVMREVDRQKGGQGRLAKRARTVNGLIGELLESPSVLISKQGSLPDVSLICREDLRPDPETEESLDYRQADDAIVGTVSALVKACADEPVKLLSNDNGVLMSARRIGVPFHRVPQEWLLSAESDEDQRRIKALEGELKRLRTSEPVCVVKAAALPWRFEVDGFEALSEAQIVELLNALKRKFPQETDFGQRESSVRSTRPGLHGIHAHFGKEEFVPATDDEIQKYQQEKYPEWISNCEAYFKELHLKLERRQPAPRIFLELINDGACPAKDVRVTFSIRGGELLVKLPDEDEEPRAADLENGMQVEINQVNLGLALPRPPAAPKGHWKKARALSALGRTVSFSGISHGFDPLTSHVHRFVSPMLPSTLESDKFYWESGKRPRSPRPSTELTCQQWRHRSIPESFEFEVVWFGGVECRKGALTVEIHAANLTDPVTKTIPIEVIAHAGDTWAEAESLIELLNKPAGLLCLPRI